MKHTSKIAVVASFIWFASSAVGHAQTADPELKARINELMGGIAPKMAELTSDVLYADIWERPELSKRDRSLVTVSALIAMNRLPQLRSHLKRAKANGVTEEEIVETITHLAFYAGWPNSVSAILVAKEVFSEE